MVLMMLALFLVGRICIADEGSALRLVALSDPEVGSELPPLAELQREDDSGKTWRKSGELPGSFLVARKDMMRCLDRRGWVVNKIIPLGKTSRRSELLTWEKGSRRLLLMLWEIEPGTCGFSMGEEGVQTRKKLEEDRQSIATFTIRSSEEKAVTGYESKEKLGNWQLARD